MLRFYKGDCLEVMDKLIKDGVKVDAIITDPPYGTTACKWDNVIPFDAMWDRLKLLRKDKTPIVLFGSEPFSSALRMSNIKEFKYDWIWEKEQGLGNLNAKKRPLVKTEQISIFYKKQCLYNPQMTKGKPYTIKRPRNTSEFLGKNGTKEGYITENNGERYPTNIKFFKRELRNRLHSTQKPVKLLEYLIKTYTNENDLVLDFTAGSGTTLLACQNLNRSCIGIDNGYCEKKNSPFYKKSWKEVTMHRLKENKKLLNY
jgi:site-specific DNA-methyltransferase (adenine-specific)